ncbi:MAG: Ig-like domain-containing protein, partial [Lachnospiraceae bacterium]|nr:Ig-like domain-containing protein [Lachnospiraceae bacterium]
IILEDVTAKGIDADKDLTLGLIGKTTVKNAGIIAGGTLTIDNAGATKVGTLDVEGENFGAILADNVIVKGGNINATGKKEAVAIKASTKIELVGGAVTANAETQPVIQAGDGTEQNPGEIIWDGCAVKSASNDIFSPNPKKSDGTEIKDICNVIYEGGKTFTVPKGEEITINESVPVKKGFHAKGWKVDSEEDVLEIGKKIKITKDITLVPAYDEIEGELSIVQDTTVAPLVEGYTKDNGVAVTIVNNTNVTFEDIKLAIDSNDFELDEDKLEQLKDKDNADGNSRTIYVKLKNGKKAGDYKTNLTVTIASGELEVKNETIIRTVKATEKPIAVSSITVTLDPSSVELEAEEKATATVKATAPVLPENATNKQATWTTSDSKIATVDSNGVVTVLSEGTVDIIATAADGSKITGKATLTVTKKKTEEKPNPDDSDKDPGQNPGGSGEVDPGKDPNKPAEEKPNGSGGQSGGSGTGATGNTPPQTPAAPSAADEVKATGIQVTADVKKADNMLVAGTMKLAPKKKMQLNVAFLPEDADEEEVTFTSSNPKVAIVDEDGEITAGKNPGKTTITVKTESGLVKSFQIQVMKKAVTKVKLQVKTKNLKVGKTIKVKATLSPNKKLASNIIYWTSSNEDVVTVTQKGVIKGLKKGKAKITAVAADGSGKKATVTIKVK